MLFAQLSNGIEPALSHFAEREVEIDPSESRAQFATQDHRIAEGGAELQTEPDVELVWLFIFFGHLVFCSFRALGCGSSGSRYIEAAMLGPASAARYLFKTHSPFEQGPKCDRRVLSNPARHNCAIERGGVPTYSFANHPLNGGASGKRPTQRIICYSPRDYR